MNFFGFLLVCSLLCANAERSINLKLNNFSNKNEHVDGIKYHLPKNTRPQNYDINLVTSVDKNESKFSGTAAIDLFVVESSNDITIHSRWLVIKSVHLAHRNGSAVQLNWSMFNETNEFFTISAREKLTKDSFYKLAIEYEGELQNDATGFYKKSYVDAKGQTKWLAIKPMGSSGARLAFPCYDEPEFKAHFTINIEHGKSFRAISNTKGTRTNSKNGRVLTHFAQTPLISTDLVAFIISDFEYNTSNNETPNILSNNDNQKSDSVSDNYFNETIEELNGRNNRQSDYTIRGNTDVTFSNPNNVPTSGPSVTSYFASSTAELLYVEQMVPSEGDRGDIYWSSCNFFFGRRGAYAGIQHLLNKVINGVPFVYNNICSIWDEKDTDPDLPTEVKLIYGRKGLHWNHFGGEGTGLHTSHPMPWFPNQWYATVIRRWYIQGEKITRTAMFMYSFADKQWTHYMSAAVPGIDIPLTGNGITGFLERFTGEAMGYHGFYGQHFRMNANGTWEKPLHYGATAGGDPSFWKAELHNNYVKLIAGGIFDNTQSNIKLEPKQVNGKPEPIIPPVVEWISAVYINSNDYGVIVEWQNSNRTPPQLSYYIQIRKDNVHGNLIANKNGIAPETKKDTLETGALVSGKYYASVQFVDIFNQKSNLAYTEFIVA